MSVRGEGRPMHAVVLVHDSVHTIHDTSVFRFTATTVLCNYHQKIVSNWKYVKIIFLEFLKFFLKKSGNFVCLKCWEPSYVLS